MDLEDKIYNQWAEAFVGTRGEKAYLRRPRWEVLKDAIISHKVKTVLEFGSGVSTMLMANLGIDLTTYETNLHYLSKVIDMCPKGVKAHLWDNKHIWIEQDYDLIFVDGEDPRKTQTMIAFKHTKGLVAIDDMLGSSRKGLVVPPEFKRIDNKSTQLAIFKKDLNG